MRVKFRLIGFKPAIAHLLAVFALVPMVVSQTGLMNAHFGFAPNTPEESQPGQTGSRETQVEGRLLPNRFLHLSFAVNGVVGQLLVAEGEQVRAGQALAQLDNPERLAAQVAAARVEVLNAQQALKELNKTAKSQLAQAEKRLAQARWERAMAASKVKHLRQGPSQLQIDQAYANLQLAEHKLEKAREDRQRAEKKWRNKKSEIWYFVGRHEYKQMLELLDKAIAIAATRVDVAQEKYDDLIEPVDEIDLAMAEADLAVSDAQVRQAQDDRQKLLEGPNPDGLALAEARIHAAETALEAAQAAQADRQLIAPIEGVVADVSLQSGEWAQAGHTVVTIIDPTSWIIETTNLTEMELPYVPVGERITVTVDALPEVEYTARVERVSGLYIEKVGDILYTVRLRLEESDPHFRWGMTVRFAVQKAD